MGDEDNRDNVTPGRLRLKIAELKSNPKRAAEVESRLHGLKGVRKVDARRSTPAP